MNNSISKYAPNRNYAPIIVVRFLTRLYGTLFTSINSRVRTKNSEVDNQLAKHCTVNLVKLATGRGLRGALVATNPLTL